MIDESGMVRTHELELDDCPATRPSLGDNWPVMACGCNAPTELHRNSAKTRYWQTCTACGASQDLPTQGALSNGK